MMDGSWNTSTMGVVLLILLCQIVRWCSSRFRCFSTITIEPNRNLTEHPNVAVSPFSALPQPCISGFVSQLDLKNLLDDLNDKIHQADEWKVVIDKSNNLFSYRAKCIKPKDGPMKYLSITVFENCSSELLRNFYMDNNFRKTWDKSLIEHEQLHVDLCNGTEIGRTIKKFPFLAPREYVLAWRVWEDKHGAFYCCNKGCEYPLAPRRKKYVRVVFHRSGWRISKVAGRNACEIIMMHQEDAGLNMEIAKLAFAKGIWSYVCRMNDALRLYSFQFSPNLSVATLIQKFPPGLEAIDDMPRTAHSESAATSICCQLASKTGTSKSSKMPSNKLLKNGLIILGGAICLSRGHSNLGAKVAMVYILSKLTKHGTFSRLSKSGKP